MTTTTKPRHIRPYFTWGILIGCLAMVLLTPGRAAAQRYSEIVVFGDSLSDPGNAFALVGLAGSPPDYLVDPLLVPSAPYARGGHHFHDGPTWVEQFARSLGLAGSVRPAFQSASARATNFAVGGARARDGAGSVDLRTQVETFLQQSGGSAPPDAFYVVALGGNDVRDALVAYSQGQNGAEIVQAALTSIASNIATLYAAGARKILVWNAPDIGLTPALRMAGPAAAHLATLISQSFNANLATVLGQLPAALPGIDLVTFDAFGLITDIVANPAAYGMTEVAAPCLTPNIAPFACQNPDTYLFWDGIHPTKATHAIIAVEIAALLRQ